jgi:hypothetical protein
MKSRWNNGMGSRSRQSLAVLVTEDGNVHQFTGMGISGVCGSTELNYTKNGKWSSSTFEVLHRDSTSFVGWSEDWSTGQAFPQASWDAGFAWLAGRAPGVSLAGFDKFIRERFPKTAERWDDRRRAESEFSGSLPLQHAEATAAKLAEIETRLAGEEAFNRQQAERLERTRWAKKDLDREIARTGSIRREAESIAADMRQIVAECDEHIAERQSFGAGAFDALAGLKI